MTNIWAATGAGGVRGGQGAEQLIEELRGIFLFEAFSDEQLRWLAASAEELAFAAGRTVFTEDRPPDALWVLLAGELRLSRSVGGREIILEESDRPGTWAGWLPMFDGSAAVGARALGPRRLLRVPRTAVEHMLTHGFPIATHLLAGVFEGVQRFEALTRQQERLAALGRLSAGLAHELNNPAAAALRAAGQLRETLTGREARALAVGRRLDEEQAAFLAEWGREAVARAAAAPPLDPLARSDREDELAAWLGRHGIHDTWGLTSTLVEAGLDGSDLDTVAARLDPAALPGALDWLCATIGVAALAGEIEGGVARVSALVEGIKEYTSMDQAPVQDVDLPAGLEATLAILAPRLGGVTVARDYDRELPPVSAHAGELNQVWTALIDNALDAMGGRGRLRVRAAREGERVLVEIGDDGPGIPPAIRWRIFDPFFTTKGVGEGTGLGLDLCRRIVARYDGDIRVESAPGDTRFQVRLPLGHAG